jgi:hypothetical protein
VVVAVVVVVVVALLHSSASLSSTPLRSVTLLCDANVADELPLSQVA